MKYRSVVVGVLSFGAALLAIVPHHASAQEVCPLEDISFAINGLSCYADGVYLSPESLSIAVSDLCYDEYSEFSCQACFSRARRKLYPVMKTLAKLDLISRGTLSDFRDALDDAEDEVCYPADDWPWDDGSDRYKRNPSSSAKTSATGPQKKGIETRQLVEKFCPCQSPRWAQSNGREDFLGCANTVIDILKRNGKLNDRKAEDLRSQLERSRCGQ
jgi:hypothetical protein